MDERTSSNELGFCHINLMNVSTCESVEIKKNLGLDVALMSDHNISIRSKEFWI